MSVLTIIKRVQQLFEDQNESWCDKDYVQSWLEMHNEDLESLLENLDLSYDTVVVGPITVTAGTTDLSSFQTETEPLENMIYPIALEWRYPGENDLQWRPIDSVDKVIDTNSSATEQAVVSNLSGILSYEWRGGTIYISPSSVDVEVRARIEALPSALNIDNTNYVKGMTNVLAYGVAEMIAGTRGGTGNSKLMILFSAWHQRALDNIADRLVKNEQKIPRRMGGRRSIQPGPLWRLPMG